MLELIQTVPTTIFLVFFYLMMVDIENFYMLNPDYGENYDFKIFYLTDPLAITNTYWENFIEL